MKYVTFIIVFSVLLFRIAHAQQPTNQALETCMNNTMAKTAAVGAVVGGLLGALLGGNDKNKTTLAGAAIGGMAGGAIGWQNSWKSCTESLNIVTIKNVQTEDYRKTAERLGYSGQGVFFKVEGARVSDKVIAGNQLDASIKVALLKPDPAETSQLTITRSWTCGNSEIKIKPEVVVVSQGTIIQEGKVQIPQMKVDMEPQQCDMVMQVEAEGSSSQIKRSFTIQPS